MRCKMLYKYCEKNIDKLYGNFGGFNENVFESAGISL